MSVLLLVEHGDGKVRDATLPAVTAAAKLGDVHALVAGANVGAVADETAKIAGIAKVMVADAPSASCARSRNSCPYRTSTLGNCSATDFSSGSSVYCEIS